MCFLEQGVESFTCLLNNCFLSFANGIVRVKRESRRGDEREESRMLSKYVSSAYCTSMFIVMVHLAVSVQAAPGCMDNSYHADACAPYDYKNYHYVECSCPCDRYAQLYSRGLCGGCHHFRVPRDPKLTVCINPPCSKKPLVCKN